MARAGRPKGKPAKGRRGGLAPHQYLSDEQLKRLLQYAKLQADRGRRLGYSRAIVTEAILQMLVYAGLRASEVCNLSISDVPVSHGKDQLYIRNGKGKVSRPVDIPESVTKKLNRFVKLHRKKAKPNDPLFIGQRGKRLCYRGLYARIKRLGEKVGLDIHPHTLRHTFGTRLYNTEKDLFYVQDQLGHKSADTTRIYSKTNNKSRRRQTEATDIKLD